MPHKIEFKVTHATSRDDEFPETQLNEHRSNTKGWQSMRHCDYPQDLVIELTKLSDVSQIQILSHQSKIAQKIDIFICEDRDCIDWQQAAWKRLGFLTLNENERSQYRARELKSVYVDCKTRLVKFSLGMNHINELNLYNQVGIIALNILGEALQKGGNSVDDIGFDMAFDALTAKQIREYTEAKRQAVLDEDYDEAKRLKLAVDHLRKAGANLAKLEKEKAEAVEKEDYDEAKRLKIEISRIRNKMNGVREEPQQPATYTAQPNYAPPPQHNYTNPPEREQPVHQPPAPTYHQEPPYVYQDEPPPAENPEPDNNMYPNLNNAPKTDISAQGGAVGFSPQQPARTDYANIQRPAQPSFRESAQAVSHGNNSIPARQNKNSANPPMNFDMNDHNLAPQSNRNNYDYADDQALMNDRPRREDQPEALDPKIRKGLEHLVELFGESLIEYLYSKKWNFRDEGLKKMLKKWENNHFQQNHRHAFRSTMKILQTTLNDKVAGVYLTGVELIQTMIDQFSGPVKADQVQRVMQSIVDRLVHQLASNNARIANLSKTCLIFLGQHPKVGPFMVFNSVLTNSGNKPARKGTPPKAKPLERRGDILAELIPQYKLPRGIQLGQLMHEMILPMLIHKDHEVRGVGVLLTTELYEHFGNKVVTYLEPLNDFLKQTVNESILEATGIANVLERQGPSIKAQNRPSITMASRPGRKKKGRKAGSKKKRGGGNKKKRQQQRNAGDPYGEVPDETEEHPGMGPGGGHKSEQYPEEKVDHHGAADDYGDDFEPTDRCNFCGFVDAKFAEDEKQLDLHFWQHCPMLSECKLCEQVIDIPSLWEHLMTECEVAKKHEQCQTCLEPFPVGSKLKAHIQAKRCKEALPLEQANRCPLCLTDFTPGEDGWNEHILTNGGCPKNARPLQFA